MTPTAAAKEWLALKAQQREIQARLDECADVLKDHMKAKGLDRFRGVALAISTYVQLDTAKARKLLGKRAAEAEVTRTRETLSAVAK